ncbi:MAG: hypothetical protein K2G31_05735, partial [Clostridia bacterium]|nr:hypothetical protein [Clostridia bacterium]
MNFWERNNFGTQNGTYNNNDSGARGNQNMEGTYGGGVYGNQNGNGAYGNQYASGAYSNQTAGGFNQGANGGSFQNGGQYTQATEQDVRQKFEQYSSKSEEQLLGELASLAERMKSDGTFDPAAIENLYNTASPFLNDMQRQRMRQLVD